MNDFCGLNLPTIVCGSGKPLIILHGFMSSKEAFLPEIKYFSEYFKVIVPDLCGFGENKPMLYPYRLDDYLSDFYKITDKLDEKASVIGHSFGCRILIKAMATSDKIDRAVLCGPAGLKGKRTLKKAVKKSVYRILRPFFKREKLEKTFFSSDYNMLNAVQKQSFLMVVNEYLDDLLPNIKNPVLAIFGERDDQTPYKIVGKKLIKNVADIGIHVMKNTGHFCFAENPIEFCSVVKEFLL